MVYSMSECCSTINKEITINHVLFDWIALPLKGYGHNAAYGAGSNVKVGMWNMGTANNV